MNAEIRIEVTAPGLDDPETQLHSRFLNFGEDVYRALRDTCEVDLAEIDAAYDGFAVRGIRRRDIGTVTTVLERILRHHKLLDDVRLVRADREPPGT